MEFQSWLVSQFMDTLYKHVTLEISLFPLVPVFPVKAQLESRCAKTGREDKGPNPGDNGQGLGGPDSIHSSLGNPPGHLSDLQRQLSAEGKVG